jgi:cellulose synthase/poly-beta-1,6-N-acetylglucosamine synthase-like glycosyltransferase
MIPPEISVIIPVYNEEDGLPTLFARLYPALDHSKRLRGGVHQRRQP